MVSDLMLMLALAKEVWVLTKMMVVRDQYKKMGFNLCCTFKL